MKNCPRCKVIKPFSSFAFLGVYKKKTGDKLYSSYCRQCQSLRNNPNRKTKRDYTPHKNKRLLEVREEVNIDLRTIYLLLKRIEINGLKMSYIDSFRLIDEYINVFGDNIPDTYDEQEQLDMMFHRLSKYIKEPFPYGLT